MKTFDEAFEVISKSKQNHDLLTENILNSKEYMLNESWCQFIEACANSLLTDLATTYPQEPKAKICTAFHTIFQIGVLIGIEMEKVDVSESSRT